MSTAKERQEARARVGQSLQSILDNRADICNSVRPHTWEALETLVGAVGTLSEQVDELEKLVAELRAAPKAP